MIRLARVLYALGCAALLQGQNIGGVPPPGPQGALPPGAATPATDDQPSAMTIGELDTRITVPVRIDGYGPFPFVIDTGAERTVIARQLGATLGLAAGPNVRIASLSGLAVAPTHILPSVDVGVFDERHDIVAPALDSRHLGALGLVGVDVLDEHLVMIDFERGEMQVQRKPRRTWRPSGRDEIVVTAKSRYGRLVVTSADGAGQPIDVVIDTGTSISVGNMALWKLLKNGGKEVRPTLLTSVTGQTVLVDSAIIDEIEMGGIAFRALPVAFVDAAAFQRMDLDRRPALLLGMNALRAFRKVEIDFSRSRIRFLLPKRGRTRPA